MTDSHLSNDEFFAHLQKLFQSRTPPSSGSIYLTQKPYTPPASSEPLILVRANNGKSASHRADKIKFSTLIAPQDIAQFYESYAEACKLGMSTGLRRRDRSGRTKKKAKKAGPITTKKT